MATKTFKIGEYCKGGVITAQVKKNVISIIAKDWDFSAGSCRGDSQKNAEEFDRFEIPADIGIYNRYYKMREYLVDLTTSYYADKVIEWVEANLNLN